MSGWRIRPARSEDAGVLGELESIVFDKRSWGSANVISSLSAPRVNVLIGGVEDRPAGFAIWRDLDGEAEVLSIGVVPRARRSGLGAAMLSALIEDAGKAGAKTLFLEVDAGNAPAISLYDAAGFKPMGVRRGYYRDGADAVLMKKDV